MPEPITSYRATSSKGALESVDFSMVAGQHYSFLKLRDADRLSQLKTLMSAPPTHHHVVATTHVNGNLVLITRGTTPPKNILATLATQGEPLEIITPRKSFDAWKLRSKLGFAGQTLQLISSFLRPSGQVDTSVLVFAASNLAANTINLVYDKGEQVEDVHHLNYLKQKVNRELSPHLNAGEMPIDIHDKRKQLRPDESPHRPLDGAKGFLKRHSVAVGELGLRYLGAVGLAFPARYWKTAFTTKTMPPMDSSRLRVYSGLSSIFGKSVALTSEIPDPYNPKPLSWMGYLREKYSFLTGGLIEITSFSALAYDCFFNSTGQHASKRGIKINGTLHRDWLGGIGASLFVLGYIARSWAKFGERNVNMGELYAHASDTLAATASEKMPQLLVNTAASLAEHFEEKPMFNFATIYTNLANDLARFHAAHESMAKTDGKKVDKQLTAAAVSEHKQPSHRVAVEGATVESLLSQSAPQLRQSGARF